MGTSNSSATDAASPTDELTQLLFQALSILRHEQPAIYRQMCLSWSQLLLEFEVRYSLDRYTSRGTVRLQLNEFVIEPVSLPAPAASPEQAANLQTRISSVIDLIDGKLELLEALNQGELRLAASPSQLLQLEAALKLFVSGAVRSLSFSGLMDQLRKLR